MREIRADVALNVSLPLCEGSVMNELDIFTAALQQQPDTRPAFLDGACAGDPRLRERIERLLALHQSPGEFFKKPAAAVLESEVPRLSQQPGDAIGPYKLLQQIGEGGMGVVYMAEQTEPVERRVALKIIKPGMDTRQVIARFEAERQALAMMDHPNIARVLDAGTTGEGQGSGVKGRELPGAQPLTLGRCTGRPYFVMELVKGLPITQYCDEQHLTPRERLELFLPVCQAVQHAHQKGIIHRDLKPSNILIARYDDKCVPKIIDFGVAKAVCQRLTERTMFTQYGQIVGTIEYMSPEQAQFNQLDVDTRSDIYSLGVLLYELLTGETPFDKQRLRTAAFDELLRIIREEEPPRPSTRLSSSEALPSIAANRKTEPKKLSTLVRGELDWIVMKALEKERGRRYETANGLAQDVQRYLADEAVQACPPSVGYRFRKFARRNKGMLVTATLLGAMLLVLAGSFGWMARSSATQRFRNAEAVAALLDQCEDALRTDRADGAAIALQAAERRAADGGADDLADRLARCRADLRLLRELDAIDTSRFTLTQDMSPDLAVSVARYRPALAAYGVAPDVDPPTAAKRVNESLIRDRLLTALDLWMPLAERSDWVRAVLRSADPDPYRDAVRDAFAARDVRALSALAGRPDALTQPARFAAIVGFSGDYPMERAREILESAVWVRPGDFTLLMTLSQQYPINQPEGAGERVRWLQAALAVNPGNSAVRNNLAIALAYQGHLDAAIAQFREAARLSPANASVHDNLGNALLTKGDLDEAIAAYKEAIRLDPKFAPAWHNLGNALLTKGNLDDATAAYQEAIRLDPTEADTHSHLANALRGRGDVDGAITELREAIRLDPNYAGAHGELGHALAKQGNLDDAIAAYREAVRLDPKSALTHNNLGRGLFEKGDMDGAIAAYKEAVRLEPADPARRRNLGLALREQGDADGAITELREAIRLDPNYAAAWHDLGFALFEQGDFDGAIAAYKEAARLEPANPARRHNLGLALRDQGDVDGAITELREAIRLDPNYAAPHGELGSILCDGKGDYDGAIVALKEAIRLDPHDATFRSNLGAALLENGDYDGAIAAFKEAIRLDPTDATFRSNLGAALFKNGDAEGAVAELREAIRLDPTHAHARCNLGNVLQQKGKLDDAIAAYRDAVRLDPKDADSHNKLGWLLAVGPAPLRDGKQSVGHATRACELTGWKEPNYIDTLAAAHAEAGDFERAVELQMQALSFPEFQQADGEGGRERLDLYERKMPYRDPALAPMD